MFVCGRHLFCRAPSRWRLNRPSGNLTGVSTAGCCPPCISVRSASSSCFLGFSRPHPSGRRPGIMLTAWQSIFARFITNRWLPTQYLFRLGDRAIPVLRYLERVVHPRWPRAFEAARHFVGVVVLLLTAALLLTPIPFSNIAPAVLIVLISLAYIEEDGLLLCLAFLFAVILISIASVAVWGTIFGALLISDI